MSRQQFYAHTDLNKPHKTPEQGANWQKLEDHLKNTATLAENFARSFGAGAWGTVAGLLHDLGKYSMAFQKSLGLYTDGDGDEDSPGKPDHSSAGAQLIVSCLHSKAQDAGDSEVQRIAEMIGRIVAHVVVGHHTGLLNNSDVGSGASLDKRLAKVLEPYTPNIAPGIAQRIEQLVDLILQNEQLDFVCRWVDSYGNVSGREAFSLQFAIRMLFSALVDADRLDSERASNPDQWRARTATKIDPVPMLLEKLEEYLLTLPLSGSVNKVRKEISQQCKDAAAHEPGFFELTVPTGGGKTLASLRFALHHAKHGMRRVIYVMPYTTIIDQNASEFQRVLDPDNKTMNVLEHHSNLEPMKETRASRLLAENWHAPVIVTTSVQFFESLYTVKPSWCRRLHSVRNSIIILDEAQTLPVRYLKAVTWVLEELVSNYDCSVLFCTATQPVLDSRRLDGTASKNHRVGITNIRPLVRNPQYYFDMLKRVDIQRIESGTPLSVGDIAKRLAEKARENKSVLCVVNTKSTAKAIFRELQEDELFASRLWHLSTSMCPQHRKDVIEIVKLLTSYCRRMGTKAPIVISTQLVEAGVNLDFDIVFRAMAGIDSIAQAAGRCNREGKMDKHGEVYFFEAEENLGSLRDIIEAKRVGIDTLSALEGDASLTQTEKDPIGIKAVEEYFQRLYWSRACDMDGKDIIARLATPRKLEQGANIPFAAIADDFRLIEKDTVSVLVPYGETGNTLVNELLDGGELVLDGYRTANRYCVQIFKDSLPRFQSLIAETLSGWLVLADGKHYNETGLLGPQELSMEDYIV